MTTKVKDIAHLSQEEVNIEVPPTESSAELRAMVDKKLKNLIGMWNERKTAHNAMLESSAPTLPGGYRYWDCLLLGPFQKSTFDLPSKVIKANEPALMVGLIWINPDPTPVDKGVSGKVVFGGEDYYTCFEVIDLTNVQNIVPAGSDSQNTFLDVPDDFTPVYLEFTLPDPGIHPTLYEVHFYVDIVKAGQPFAAMATWHWDPDGDGYIPGWHPVNSPDDYNIPDIPATWNIGPHFDHDQPARFLVHRA